MYKLEKAEEETQEDTEDDKRKQENTRLKQKPSKQLNKRKNNPSHPTGEASTATTKVKPQPQQSTQMTRDDAMVHSGCIERSRDAVALQQKSCGNDAERRAGNESRLGHRNRGFPFIRSLLVQQDVDSWPNSDLRPMGGFGGATEHLSPSS